MASPDRSSASDAFTAGVVRSLPVGLGVLVYGLVFGALTAQKGLSLAEATSMSAIVFAGSAQFVALGLWTVPPPVLALALATFLINFRFFLMAATMDRVIGDWPKPRALLALFFVTDENWAVTMAEGERRHWGAFFLGTGIVVYASWLAATVLGYVIGGVVSDPKQWGFDFAFPAMFLALAVAIGRKAPAPLVWIASAAAALAADRWIGGSAPVLLGGLAGAGVAALGAGGRRAP
ncbi:MAG TPA: AzlC family ABC transporter permease [Stellaceae bacterium]|nr:AzlC family ABC transporter permease [Stellaceae bacterium]